METHLEKVALRFHKRLLRYHKHALAFNVIEDAWLGILWHTVAVNVETACVLWHQSRLWKRGEK